MACEFVVLAVGNAHRGLQAPIPPSSLSQSRPGPPRLSPPAPPSPLNKLNPGPKAAEEETPPSQNLGTNSTQRHTNRDLCDWLACL